MKQPAAVEQQTAQLAMETAGLGRRAAVRDQLRRRHPIEVEVDEEGLAAALAGGSAALLVDHDAVADPPQVAHHLALVLAAERLSPALEQAAVDVLDQVVDGFGLAR